MLRAQQEIAKAKLAMTQLQDQRLSEIVQDPNMDGSGLRFETLEHGGEFPDTMPQAIRLMDAEGRSCLYVPVKVAGRVVDSKRFTLEP